MAKKKARERELTLDELYATGWRYQPLGDDAPAEEAKPEPSSMARRALGDTGIAALKGAIGVPEAMVGMADLVTGGRAGRVAESAGFRPKEAKDFLDTFLSPEQQAANQAVQQAEGFGGKLGAAVTNPSVIWQSAVESAPSMIGGAAAARGLLKAAPAVSPIVAAGAGEGAVAAGQAAEQVRQQTPDGLLTPTQAALAAGSGALTGGIAMVAGRIANNMGIGDIDTLLVGVKQASPTVQKGFVRRMLEGAVSEGVLEELPQSVQEQVAQNLALGKPLSEGVDHAAVIGMLTGSLMGAAVGPMAQSTPASKAIRDEKLPEVGPLTKALNAATEHRAQQVDAGMPTVSAAEVGAQAAQRVEELGAKESGSEQTEVPTPGEGEPVVLPAVPGQPLTPNEQNERTFLTDNAQSPEVLARASGATVANVPASPPADTAAASPTGYTPTTTGPNAAPQPAPSDTAAIEQRNADATTVVLTDPLPGDIMGKVGPFRTMQAAARALTNAGPDHELVRVKGGLVVRKTTENPPDGRLPVGNEAPAAPAVDAGVGRAGDDAALIGDPIDDEWTAFKPEATKGVPRADMPQIKAEHRGALTQFMLGQGIEHAQAEVNPADLKPTQQEFAPAKVAKAREFVGEDRAILVSSDGYVLDGHHQWLAKRETGVPIRVIAFNAPIEQLIGQAKEFPSALQADGATAVANPLQPAESAEVSQQAVSEKPTHISDTNEPQDRQGLRAEDRRLRDRDAAAAELAGQMQEDVRSEDFDPAEVLPALERFAAEAKQPADELRNEVLKRLRASDIPVDQLRKLADALNPVKRAQAAAKQPKKRFEQGRAARASKDAARAGYFTPGNIVRGYSGFDEVLAYTPPDENGRWSVRVQEAREVTPNHWVRVGKPHDARLHSTEPDAKELERGPVGRMGHQPGAEVQYTEPRADGTPFPNAPDRGTAPAPAPLAQPPEQADTPNQEKPDDSPAPTPAPAVDRTVAEGPAEPAERPAKPRARARRADGGSVRGQGDLLDGVHDGQEDLGNSRGAHVVHDGAPEPVGRDSERVSAPDFRAGPGALTREGSWFATATRNVDLIELARKIDSEGRPATSEEQARLAKYVGFGASEIRNALFPVPSSYLRSQDPKRLIFPDLVREARWKPLAERLAALPEDWQKSVLQSTQYAHYTSEGVIRSTWDALQRIGFTGGKVLEPGMGIGSFAILMPETVHKRSKYTGIEFDAPTALIARLLSPQQNMLHDDFIKRRLPKDYFDLAIGNPPFAKTVILADPDYEKMGLSLHDFFFAKSLDRVRPGGLLAFVTSHHTMDKQSDKARRYLSARADLLGAIRLPQTAFESNAGTSVTTDVIFLRKRAEGEAQGGQPWADAKTIETKDGNAVVNEYFAAHPEMVLGQQRLSGNRDDQDRYISGLRSDGEYTVVSYDESPADLEAKFAEAVEKLPANVYSVMKADAATIKREAAKVEFNPKVRREGVVYLADDGTLMRVQDGAGVELAAQIKLSDKDAEWFKGYVGVRELVQQARAAQFEDADWQTALKALNKAYDGFRKKHGPINDFRVQVRTSTDEEGNPVETPIRIFKNRRLFREDYDNAIVTQLETINEAGEIVKSPFLLGRTIGKPVTREVKTIGDALAVSLDETGHLDLEDVGRRIGLSRDDAIDALGDQVYRTPQGQWQLADEYLSGDVVRKLEEAQTAARDDRALERNVKALVEVQPEKLGPSQIGVKLGASWVPSEYVTEFAKEIEAGAVTFDPKTETWQVSGGNLRSERRAGAEYGTAKRSPSELLEAALNSRAVTIKEKVRDGDSTKEVTDNEGTTAAQEAIKKIKDKFKSWIWTDSERAATLVDIYNRRFNNIAGRRFDGSHLTLPGVSLRFKLHPHQLRAIWRQVQTGNTYLAHAVGAGKTIEMIAGGMEQRRLGLIQKPIYVVPNHMLEQFANEFMELYPLANIMVADDENFSAERRKAFVAAATLNAPDAIIITHSAFERIGVKEESVAVIRDEILDDLQSALGDVGKDDRVRRSQLEQQIEAVTQRFDAIVGAGKKDSTIKFEDIGVDMVYADEAHAFRKLDFTTNQKIKGIDPNGSRRSLDMYVKTRHLEKKRPGRSMVWASGTPVTNTMGELYTVMRFFAGDALDAAGISSFDSWSRQFGEAVSALEANAAGRYETVERFAKFDNVPELMSRVRQFMDVLTSEQLGALVKRPDIEGGKPNLVTVEPTEALKSYMRTVLVPRLEASKRWKPSFGQPFNPDPVIAITSDGRFAALDPRFFGAPVDENTPTKLNTMADRIIANYKATANNVYTDRDGKPEAIKGSTQIVFYNLGFGEQSQKNRGFNAKGALTKRLVDGGVQRDHILWFDDANTDAKKEAMFKAMRAGQARILIGSAKKMGTGVNVQKRLKRLHYFDPPWYPSDVEQPHGRIIRQGNQNDEVGIDWYATKGTYDSTMWQMVGRKQRFIDQAFMGDKSVRSMEDVSEASLYEQAAAVASGDPRALQLAGLKQDVERLERLQAAHASEQIKVRDALRNAQWYVEHHTKAIAGYEAAFKLLGDRFVSWVSGQVGARTYEKQTDFGQALKDAFNKKAADYALNPDKQAIDIGSVGQAKLRMHPGEDNKGRPTGNFELAVHVGDWQDGVTGYEQQLGVSVDALGLARRVMNTINGLSQKLDRARSERTGNETDVTRLKKKLGAPFEHAQELVEKVGDLHRLEAELRAEGEAASKADAQAAKAGTVIKEDGSTPDEQPAALRVPADVPKARTTALTQVAEALTTQWTNAPSVVVVDSLQDTRVPQAVRTELARQDEAGAVDGITPAVYAGNTVYLVAPHFKSTRDAMVAIFHEALGHHGLRHTFGKELATILDRVAILNQAKVRTKAKVYGLDYDKPSDRRIAAEEVLAEMAQTNPQLGWVKRAIAAIRTWLRDHVAGFNAMQFSDDELIRSFIIPAREWVQRGGKADAPNMAPAFSRVSDTIDTLRSAATEQGLRNLWADHLQSDKTFNWWHNTIGTQFQKAKADPVHFGPVYEATQDYLHDTSAFANDAAAFAPDVVPQLKSWRDSLKPLRLQDADGATLAKTVFTGTLVDQKVYTDDELKAQGLDARQIDLYRQMRASIDRSLDTLVASDVARYLGKDLPKPIKAMISDGDTGRFKGLVTALAQQELAKAEAELQEVRKANRKRLAEMHRDHKTRREAAKGPMAKTALEDTIASERAQMLAETKSFEESAKGGVEHWRDFKRTIDAKYERVDQLKAEGYAPLMRFGRYTLDVVAPDGTREFFSLYESQADANKAARDFRDNPEFDGSAVSTGILSEEAYKQFAGIAPETIELFADLTGVEQTPLFQEYLRRAKSNRSALKRLIQRKGVAGYSEDAQRVLASFVTSNARAASSNLHIGDMGDLIEAIPKSKGDVKDEAIRLKEYVQNPTEEAGRLRGLLFVQYLGGSVASAMVNMTQPFMMTFPYLSQFGGAAKAAARLGDAVKAALGKPDGALGAALAKAEKEGIVSPQELHQLQAEASRTLANHPVARRMLFVWGSMFSLAEQFNRRVSFIAGWNTAVANGNPNPYAFATATVDQTQGVYNKGNRPNWARGAVGATLFTFKQYSISYMEFLKRLPPKERAIALLVLVLAAGAQGLPFADDLDDLIDTLGQHMGYDTNAKAWKTKVLKDALGEWGADFALHGFSAMPGFPLDVSGRLAMSNLIPGTGTLLKSKTDKTNEVLETIGPAGGLLKDAIRGDFAPLAIRNLGKSITMFQTGEYRDTKNRKVVDVSPLDALVKGVGFQPAAVAREQRGINIANARVQLARNVEGEIASTWAQGIADREPDKVREAKARLAEWNQDNPNSRIGITTRQLERRVKEIRMTRKQRFDKAVPKEMRGSVE
jgi:N12 class adenine-specific DNA methylase